LGIRNAAKNASVEKTEKYFAKTISLASPKTRLIIVAIDTLLAVFARLFCSVMNG
jgi:hypothetical protein